MGSGLGWIDYDLDTWPDLYLPQGTAWSGTLTPSTSDPSDCLFRNLRGSFKDISDSAHIADYAYGMGVAIGDCDNDGFPDVYVSNFGPNSLFHNNGDGTFTKTATTARPMPDEFNASVSWIDIQADGVLDLILTGYLQIDPDDYLICRNKESELAIVCPPWRFSGVMDRLLVADGTGQYQDESAARGLNSVEPAQGLGVVCSDLDLDGDTDIYIANDSVPNHLWTNDGNGHFTEDGFISGTALNRAGKREAGMGVACADVDSDGRPDLFVTNFYSETNTLYRNEGQLFFLDVTDEIGLGAPSRPRLGFGTTFLDADNNGNVELFVGNGHIHDQLKELGRDIPFAQRSQLFSFQQNRFHDISETAGPFFQQPMVVRSCATADFDQDNRCDLALTTLNGPAMLLTNQSQSGNNCLRLRLIGTDCNRDAIGARVLVQTDQRTITIERQGSSSYLSCNDSILHAGIGTARQAQVTVYWPGSAPETWPVVPDGQTSTLIQGRSAMYATNDDAGRTAEDVSRR
jgi:hypothetical protein